MKQELRKKINFVETVERRCKEVEKIMEEYKVRKVISRFLTKIEMKNSSLGFGYWITAIAYCTLKLLNKKCEVVRISEIYNYISKEYNTSVSCVEKAMRYAKENSKYIEILKLGKMDNQNFATICVDTIVSKVAVL